MFDNKCKICGGRLIVSLGTGYATCENCGNASQPSAEELAKLRAAVKNAENRMRLNSAAGYEEALEQLRSISFVSEAQQKAELCRRRLNELRGKQAEREKNEGAANKSDTRIGIIILILFILLILLAIAGGVYVAVHLYRGDLSPKAVAAIVITVVIIAALLIAGNARF